MLYEYLRMSKFNRRHVARRQRSPAPRSLLRPHRTGSLLGVTWVYLLLATAGLVITVPAIARAVDHNERDPTSSFFGFAALVAGVTGLLLGQLDVPLVATLVAAASLGLATGFLHPELLNLIAPPPSPAPSPETVPAPDSSISGRADQRGAHPIHTEAEDLDPPDADTADDNAPENNAPDDEARAGSDTDEHADAADDTGDLGRDQPGDDDRDTDLDMDSDMDNDMDSNEDRNDA